MKSLGQKLELRSVGRFMHSLWGSVL